MPTGNNRLRRWDKVFLSAFRGTAWWRAERRKKERRKERNRRRK
jgi:hypothetical protein